MPVLTRSLPYRPVLKVIVAKLRAIQHRVWQFARQLSSHSSREVDSTLAALLPPDQFDLVRRLSPADRRHLLAVHQGLVSDGWTDPDLLTAALLHDAGKVDDHGQVHTLHRVMKVLLSVLAPGVLPRLARQRGGWLRHGIYLSVNHASIGAELARNAGASERACWLIAHHDDGRISGGPALEALQVRDARD